MPKRRKAPPPTTESFGQRMAHLRMQAGYTQRELAKELEISQRMVAYYEGETDHPPADLLPNLARIFGVSTDELLGLTPVREVTEGRDSRLWRRFQRVGHLPTAERRQIVQFIDALLERAELRRQKA